MSLPYNSFIAVIYRYFSPLLYIFLPILSFVLINFNFVSFVNMYDNSTTSPFIVAAITSSEPSTCFNNSFIVEFSFIINLSISLIVIIIPSILLVFYHISIF